MPKLEDVKDQSALDALLTAAVDSAVNTAITGLATKNDELLGKLKIAKENAAPEDIDTMRKAVLELEQIKTGKLEEQGEFKKLYDTATAQHLASTEAQTVKLKEANAEIKRLLVQDGLSKELISQNINPVLMDAAIHLLEKDVSVIDSDGKKIAQVGDKTLTDHVKDWASTDVGKNFILASGNSGGGAGGNGDTSLQSEAEVHFQPKTWNLTEQAKLSKTDPKLYDNLHQKHPTRNASGQQT